MNEPVERIILRTIDEARASGRDYIGQTEAAIAAARDARPDMTASEIMATVRLLQNQ